MSAPNITINESKREVFVGGRFVGVGKLEKGGEMPFLVEMLFAGNTVPRVIRGDHENHRVTLGAPTLEKLRFMIAKELAWMRVLADAAETEEWEAWLAEMGESAGVAVD
jgi:hypothetical protein